MNNKRVSKIIFKFICVFSIIFLLFSINMVSVNATDKITGSGAISEFETKSKITVDNNKIATNTESIISPILNIVQIIAVGIAIIMLIVLAMKYMFCSIEEKAEIKKHAVVYVIGATVMFGATGIIEIIKQFTKNIKY